MPVTKDNETPFIAVKQGLRRKLVYTENLMTVINEFYDGPWAEPEPPHSHPHEQTAYVAEGEVIYYCEDEAEQHLKAGDMFSAPPGKKHAIKCLTSIVRIVDSFTPIRSEFLEPEGSRI